MARDKDARRAGILLLMAILIVQTQGIPRLTNGDEESNDIDVIFLVDGSSDVSEDDFQLLKHFLVGAVGTLDVTSESARVAIVQMGGPAQVQLFLNCSEDKHHIFSTVKAMKKLRGPRNLGTAFELTRSLVMVASHGSRFQMGTPTVVVSLVTGPPDDDFERSATILQSLGVRLAVLSVSESNSLVSAASSPTLVHSFSSFQHLQSFVESFHKFLYQPDDKAEIVFLLDVPDHEDGVKAMQTFVLQMAHRFNLGPVRLGVVVFCEKAEILLPLGISHSVEDVALKLEGRFLPCEGLTNTGAAIEFTVNSVLAPGKQDVAQSIVLITFNPADDDISGVSELLVRRGVTLFAVGVRDGNLSQLMSMVTHGGYYFQLSHAHLLTHLQGKILNLALYDHAVSKVTTLTTFAREIHQQADLVFLLDISNDVGDENVGRVVEVFAGLLSKIEVGSDKVRVALMQYTGNQEPKLHFNLDTLTSNAAILRALHSMEFRKSSTPTKTSTDESFVSLFQRKSRPNVPKILILFTDGTNHGQFGTALHRLKDLNVHTFVVGVGKLDKNPLTRIASSPVDKHIILVHSFSELNAAINKLTSAVRKIIKVVEVTVPSASVLPQDVRNGTLTVLVPQAQLGNKAKTTVEPATSGTGKTIMAQEIHQQGDLVFLVDFSNNVGDDNFMKVTEFLTGFLDKLELGPSKVRVALVQYTGSGKTSTTQIRFNLDTLTDKSSILSVLRDIKLMNKSMPEGSSTEDSLSAVFHTEGRGNVPKILILLTDGTNNDKFEAPLQRLRDTDVKTFVIGVGNVEVTRLKRIVSSPDEQHIILVDNFSSLETVKEKLTYLVDKVVESPEYVIATSAPILPQNIVTETPTVRNPLIAEINQFTTRKSSLATTTIAMASTNLGLTEEAEVGTTVVLEAHATLGTPIKQGTASSTIPHAPAAGVETGGTTSAQEIIPKTQTSPEEMEISSTTLGLIVTENQESTISFLASTEEPILVDTASPTVAQVPLPLHPAIGMTPALQFFPENETTTGITQEIHQQGDIVFLVDFSNNIGDDNFMKVTKFLTSFLDKLELGPSKVRVALVQYTGSGKTSATQIQLNLDTLTDKSSILSVLRNIKLINESMPEGASTEDSISAVFGTEGRGNIPKILILLTDGTNNDKFEAPLQRLIDTHVKTFVIGVGNVEETRMKRIVSSHDEQHIILVNNFSSLDTVIEKLTHLVDKVVEIPEKVIATSAPILPQNVVTETPTVWNALTAEINLFATSKSSPVTTTVSMASSLGSTEEGELGTTVAPEAHATIGTPIEPGTALSSAIPHAPVAVVQTIGTTSAQEIIPEIHTSPEEMEISSTTLGLVLTENQASTIPFLAATTEEPIQVDIAQPTVAQVPSPLHPSIDTTLAPQISPEDETTAGIAQEIHQQGDLVFLVDFSNNVGDDNFMRVTKFLSGFLHKLELGPSKVRVALVQYTGSGKTSATQIRFNLDTLTDKSSILSVLRDIKLINESRPEGASTEDSLSAVFGTEGRGNIPKILILLTDGTNNDKFEAPLQRLIDTHVKTFVIGVGNVEETRLKRIVSSPDEQHIILVDNFSSLDTVIEKLTHLVAKVVESPEKVIATSAPILPQNVVTETPTVQNPLTAEINQIANSKSPATTTISMSSTLGSTEEGEVGTAVVIEAHATLGTPIKQGTASPTITHTSAAVVETVITTSAQEIIPKIQTSPEEIAKSRDLLLLIDSPSLLVSDFLLLRAALLSNLQLLLPQGLTNNRLIIIQAASLPRLELALGPSANIGIDTVSNAILNMQQATGNSCNLSDAVHQGLQMLKGPNSSRDQSIILITGGPCMDISAAASMLQASGTQIFTVGPHDIYSNLVVLASKPSHYHIRLLHSFAHVQQPLFYTLAHALLGPHHLALLSSAEMMNKDKVPSHIISTLPFKQNLPVYQKPGTDGGISTSVQDYLPSHIKEISCKDKAQDVLSMDKMVVICPGGCNNITDYKVYGQDVYSLESMVCMAGIHFGLLPPWGGWLHVSRLRVSKALLPGVSQHGVRSLPVAARNGVFFFQNCSCVL